VTSLLSHWGYLAVFVLMVAESACIPIPSELVMMFGGALAASGTLSLVAVIVVGTLANLVGALLAWAAGRWWGRAAILRWGRYVGVHEQGLVRAEAWFARFGQPTVFFGRVLPVVRTFVSVPAGVGEMPVVRFGVLTLVGSVIWNAALAVAGFELGAHWQSVEHQIGVAGDVVAVLVVAALAVVVLRWRLRRRPALEAD
jgi:membrane protein DedA with SNARE-associated domain